MCALLPMIINFCLAYENQIYGLDIDSYVGSRKVRANLGSVSAIVGSKRSNDSELTGPSLSKRHRTME